jgi:hypothetical protein
MKLAAVSVLLALSLTVKLGIAATIRDDMGGLLGGYLLKFAAIPVIIERPRTPKGPGMCRSRSRFPAISMAIPASWLIVIISLEPIFTGPVKFERASRSDPSRHSSMYRNERVCSPSPQISISPPGSASATFRQIAAGTFSLPPVQVSRAAQRHCDSGRS